MNKAKGFTQKGFTLIEAMIAIAIFVIFIFVVTAIINNIFVRSNQQLSSLQNIDQARTVLSAFVNEIRNATTGSDGAYALNLAGDSQVIFFSSLGGSASTIQRIRYFVSDNISCNNVVATGNTLCKGTILPSGSPLRYNLSSESVKAVLSGLSGSSNPVFYYYDGNYSGTGNSLSQPVNLNQVRFVKMTLAVLNQIVKNDNSVFSISAGVTIRAVKDNLGN